MCARLLACPLCSQPGFLTLDALRAGLVSVATRPLVCPVCNEILLGIDKLTIHLFGHTINLNNNAIDTSKHMDSGINNSNNQTNIHNIQDNNLQDWNLSKTQSTEVIKLPSQDNRSDLCSSQHIIQSCDNVLHNENENTISNPQVHIQNHDVGFKSRDQIIFSLNQACEESSKNVFQEFSKNNRLLLESDKNSQKILSRTVEENPGTQYYSNNNVKLLNTFQKSISEEQGNVQLKQMWLENQHSLTDHISSIIMNDTQKPVTEVIKSTDNYETTRENTATVLSNEENEFQNFQSVINIITSETQVEQYNNEKNLHHSNENAKQITLQTNQTTKEIPEQNLENVKILPNLKAFKALATKEKTERCNICGFHFPNYNILILHKQLVHMIDEKDLNVTPEDLLKNYSCHLCSKVFKMRGSLMVHMRVAHTGYSLGSLSKDGQIDLTLHENGYNCPTCGKKFKKEQHVIQHLKTHEGKQWECDVCSKLFTTKYFLKKHKRLHSGEMPYKCNICNKTFTFQQSYHKHRLYHKDDKPHTCTTCGRSFKELSTLHNHERIHTGEKPFACETCGKCFRQRVSYLVHRRIHTGVMPYKCTMCGKNFRYKVSQRTHKCPMQSVGNAQANDLVQKLIESTNTQSTNSEPYGLQKTDNQQQNQSMLNVIDNDESKYVLVINTQGQHVLTKESDMRKVSPLSKEQNIEFTKVDKTNKEIIHTWNTNITNTSEPNLTHSVEICNKEPTQDEKLNIDHTNDFFSMVMSPIENELSSPTTEMKHLRVSSPGEKKNLMESFNGFRHISENMQMNIIDTSIGETYSNNNVANSLQTINEESLKQLLYGINRK